MMGRRENSQGQFFYSLISMTWFPPIIWCGRSTVCSIWVGCNTTDNDNGNPTPRLGQSRRLRSYGIQPWRIKSPSSVAQKLARFGWITD
jgi:hypothetical protein